MGFVELSCKIRTKFSWKDKELIQLQWRLLPTREMIFSRYFIKSVILCRLIWVFFFFGYVLHVQDLCEWRERQILLFNLLSLAFLYYFLFWEEKDIKLEQKYLFILNFNKGRLQISNGGNHKWVKCQN